RAVRRRSTAGRVRGLPRSRSWRRDPAAVRFDRNVPRQRRTGRRHDCGHRVPAPLAPPATSSARATMKRFGWIAALVCGGLLAWLLASTVLSTSLVPVGRLARTVP